MYFGVFFLVVVLIGVLIMSNMGVVILEVMNDVFVVEVVKSK